MQIHEAFSLVGADFVRYWQQKDPACALDHAREQELREHLAQHKARQFELATQLDAALEAQQQQQQQQQQQHAHSHVVSASSGGNQGNEGGVHDNEGELVETASTLDEHSGAEGRDKQRVQTSDELAAAAAAAAASGTVETSLQGGNDRVEMLLHKFEDQCKESTKAERKLFSLFKTQAQKILEHVPIVEVATKVTELSEYDMKNMQFTCKVIVMLNWRDESLWPFVTKSPSGSLLTRGGTSISAALLARHFLPRISFTDVRHMEYEGEPEFKINTATSPVDVKYTAKLCLSIGAVPDLTHFPFDIQVLQLQIQLQKLASSVSVSEEDVKSAGSPSQSSVTSKSGLLFEQLEALARMAPKAKDHLILADPVTWRPTEGHMLSSNSTWMVEYEPVWIDGCNVRDVVASQRRLSSYVVQIAVRRKRGNVFWNLLMPLFILVLLGISPFGVSRSALEDRIGLLMLIVFAIIGFKFYVSETMPKKQTVTALDTYLNLSLGYLAAVGCYFLATSFLHYQIYNCDDDFEAQCLYTEPFGLSCEVLSNFTINNCARVATADTWALGISVVFAIGIQVYFAVASVLYTKRANINKATRRPNRRGRMSYIVNLQDPAFNSRFSKLDVSSALPVHERLRRQLSWNVASADALRVSKRVLTFVKQYRKSVELASR